MTWCIWFPFSQDVQRAENQTHDILFHLGQCCDLHVPWHLFLCGVNPRHWSLSLIFFKVETLICSTCHCFFQNNVWHMLYFSMNPVRIDQFISFGLYSLEIAAPPEKPSTTSKTWAASRRWLILLITCCWFQLPSYDTSNVQSLRFMHGIVVLVLHSQQQSRRYVTSADGFER